MKKTVFTGAATAIITPFKNGKIDYASFEKLINWQIAEGIDATQPFVQVGDRVNPDTTVCIIEAMKVMNEVKAEKSGVIKEILVENAQAVEYGQPIFVIE